VTVTPALATTPPPQGGLIPKPDRSAVRCSMRARPSLVDTITRCTSQNKTRSRGMATWAASIVSVSSTPERSFGIARP
jgi:hypothetical protein